MTPPTSIERTVLGAAWAALTADDEAAPGLSACRRHRYLRPPPVAAARRRGGVGVGRLGPARRLVAPPASKCVEPGSDPRSNPRGRGGAQRAVFPPGWPAGGAVICSALPLLAYRGRVGAHPRQLPMAPPGPAGGVGYRRVHPRRRRRRRGHSARRCHGGTKRRPDRSGRVRGGRSGGGGTNGAGMARPPTRPSRRRRSR